MIRALRSGWLTGGPRVAEFEKLFCNFLGAPASAAVSSCTGGLHCALAALSIGAGDEVITSTNTFAGGVNMIELVGARPIFVDVEPQTLNMDPQEVERAITPRTRAIMIVHFAGHPARMRELCEIASNHQLSIIEDAAHALPARYDGALIGSSSRLTAFSFYATKNLTTGEGGMITGNADLVARAKLISAHGISRNAWDRLSDTGRDTWRYDVLTAGLKYTMTDLQAAMGVAQLRHLADMQEKRKRIFQQYSSAFSAVPSLEVPHIATNVEHSHHLYVLRLHLEALRIDRNDFIEELRARNIGTSVHFIPMHTHTYYHEKYKGSLGQFPIAEKEFQRSVTLPVYPAMADHDVSDVIEAVIEVATKFHR